MSDYIAMKKKEALGIINVMTYIAGYTEGVEGVDGVHPLVDKHIKLLSNRILELEGTEDEM